MDVFLKAAAVALVSVILGIMLSKNGKEAALLLSVLTCCMVAAAAVRYLEPVMDFFVQLQELAELDSDLLSILLKAVGIGLLGEIAALVCSDAGNGALAKTIQMLCTAVILWMSLPLFTGLLDLVGEILEEV